jgi:meiotic recombination protein DMC1
MDVNGSKIKDEQDAVDEAQGKECMLVDELQDHGILATDVLKLKQAGICTVKGIAMVSKRNLCKIKGLSEMRVDKIKEAANRVLKLDFITAAAYAQRRGSVFCITTGSTDFDAMLNGGIQTMSITEVFGEFRTGKTQLASTLCITVQLDAEQGGCNGRAAFIDTEGTFRPERLRKIAERFGLDPEEALENVIFARAFNSEHQSDLLANLSAKFSEEGGRYKLLVIDSVVSLFRSDFTGRGELGERQQRLNQFLAKLLQIAEEFNLAVLITNQVMADPSGGLAFAADPKKPIGGHVLAHASTTRIYLRKGKSENRIAKIYDSPDVPESEAMYSITDGGIDNSKE